MIEVWKPVVGFEHYQVSNLGNVRSPCKILKPQINISCGYKFVQLNPGRKNRYIGQLVLEAFVSPRPHKQEVDHVNRIRTDDRLSNLKWVSHSENNLNKNAPVGSSGVRGVSYNSVRNKWVSQTTIHGKHKTIGYFNTLKQAELAYLKFKRGVKNENQS